MLATLALSAALLAGPALATSPGSAEPDLLDVAQQAGGFETLSAALQAADLVDVLRGDGPFTVFAPTDEAFAKLPEGTVESLLRPEARDDLIAILTYHVVPGRVSAVDAVVAGATDALSGDELTFRLEAGQLRVGDAGVIANDVQARNGVIHIIDSVLLPPAPAPLPTVEPFDVLALAIDRGVPLFNAGQTSACASIYEIACLAVLALGPDRVPESVLRQLDSAVREGAQQAPANRAWALRGAMDDAMLVLATSSMDVRLSSSVSIDRPAPRVRSTLSENERFVFQFDGTDSGSWPSVNDDVMGGISKGRTRLTDRGTVLFAGALSLENNGGFSTVRSDATDLDLAGWDGLVLRVRGDGRTYNVSALPDGRRRAVHSWEMPFDTEADEWIEVRVPFDQLVHRAMGWRIPDGALDPASIRSLAFGISDKDTSPFALELDWIKAYRDR
jgi:uncharacterized surface protein with fasciclin (FAS1) repeats